MLNKNHHLSLVTLSGCYNIKASGTIEQVHHMQAVFLLVINWLS